MKILSQSEVLAILNNEEKPSIVNEHYSAVKHEQRLRLHSETRLNYDQGQHKALSQFLTDLPYKILPKEKYEMFKSLLTTPLPTVEVVDSAYNELYKLFFGQNRVIDFRFTANDEILQKDWAMYRNLNGFKDWFRLEGWNVFKNHINAPIVVDLPPLMIDEEGRASMGSDKPEPFFFFVPTENVIDQFNDHNNSCHYLMYENEASEEMKELQQIDKIAYYIDSERYSTYIRKQDVWTWAADSPHDLGYTPCKSFWNKPLRNSTYERQNPITPNLGALDWMLYSIISKRNLDLFAGFPIVSLFEQQCDYKNADGFDCEGGIVRSYTNPQRTNTIDQECPKCSANQMIGAGSTIYVPLPDPEMDSAVNLMPGVNVTNGDVESLKQMNDELERQRKEFMVHVTGFDNGGSQESAPSKNNAQIRAHMDSRHSVIMEIKEGFEVIEKFVLDTAGKLRYGDDYLDSIVNYGSRFFLKSSEEMQVDYKQAKENGMPSFELSNMRAEIYEKKYASDPKILQRMKLLNQLEPYPDYTVAQLQGLSAFIDTKELAFKISFNDLVAKFEREFGPIDQYFSSMDLEMRVELIRTQLMKYLSEMTISFGEQTNDNNNNGGEQQTVSEQEVHEK